MVNALEKLKRPCGLLCDNTLWIDNDSCTFCVFEKKKTRLIQQHDIVELFPTQQEYKVKITEEGNSLSQEFKEGLNTIIRMYLIDALRNTDNELDIRVKDNGSMRVVIKEGHSILNKTVTPKGESD